ncbi:MAG: hypothetical protein MUC57_08270 [Desulfobacterales bacterium]|nr:hypothetical protein [Desulfobacterales bacterium]
MEGAYWWRRSDYWCTFRTSAESAFGAQPQPAFKPVAWQILRKERTTTLRPTRAA